MSPRRRQTRASATSNTTTNVSKRHIPEDVIPVARTRSGLSRSNPPSPSKPARLCPSKRLTPAALNVSSCQKNLSQPSSPKKGSSKIADKTSVKCTVSVKNSPLKSPSKTSENVLKKKTDKPVGASVPLRSSPRKTSPKTPNALNNLSKQDSNENQLLSSPSKETQKPLKSTSLNISSPSKQTPKSSPTTQGRSTRKRLLPSPSQSPQSPKTRRLRGNVLAPVQIKAEPALVGECDFEEVKCEVKDEPGLGEVSKQFPGSKKSEGELPSDPELSGRFLRRKWFSLKARGGFTCLRSAILSPEEIAQEIIQHTNVDTSQDQDSNFFTTKLMVRLSSRLPPAKARPSCEELVDFINSKQTGQKTEAKAEQKREGTAIRVKLERRSFSDTMSHIKSKPVKVTDKLACASESGPKPETVAWKGDGNLTKKQERDLALQQLKNLSATKEKKPQNFFKKAATPTRREFESRYNGRRWFSLKSRGSYTSLRSAILSPEELTQEFMKRTKLHPQNDHTLNSVEQHNSRVGSSKPRLSPADLVGVISSMQVQKNFESLVDHKGQDSPSHTKVVNDHIRKREQEIALQQLNVLRYW